MPNSLLDPSSSAHDHVTRRLAGERILWLTTVSADARPHTVPVWFGWQDPVVVVFSPPETAKVRRLRRNPAVSLSLDSAGGGADIVTAEGTAELPELDAVAATAHAAGFAAKYAGLFGDQTFEQWLPNYSQPIVVTVTKVVAWALGADGLQHVSVP